MQGHKEQWSVGEMAKTLGVSRSGYYRFIKAKVSEREKQSLALLAKIRLVHKESRETYGSPRIHAQLQEEGETCSRKHVAMLMKK
jgi:putative transposase